MAISLKDKVASGQPFEPNAEVQNALIAYASQFNKTTPEMPYGAERVSYLPIQIVDNANEQAPGTVVGFGDPIALATDGEEGMATPVFSWAPASTGRWAVAQQGLGVELQGECTLIGLAWAEVDITNTSHEYADVDGVGTLTSGATGYALIRYKPAGTGVLWCCLQLGANTGGGSTTCAQLRDIYDVGTTVENPPRKFLAIHTTDEICSNVEVVECGTDATPPCAGCTGQTPTYLLLDITGVDFDPGEPAPPANYFDIAAGSGNEILLTRASRCGYEGAIPFWYAGEDPQAVSPTNLDISLLYDAVGSEWVLEMSISGGDVIVSTPEAGPHNCMTRKSHTVTDDTDPMSDRIVTGWIFQGGVIGVEPRETVL